METKHQGTKTSHSKQAGHRSLVYSSLVVVGVLNLLQALLKAGLVLPGYLLIQLAERLALHQKPSAGRPGSAQALAEPPATWATNLAAGGSWWPSRRLGQRQGGDLSGLSSLNQQKARPKLAEGMGWNWPWLYQQAQQQGGHSPPALHLLSSTTRPSLVHLSPQPSLGSRF